MEIFKNRSTHFLFALALVVTTQVLDEPKSALACGKRLQREADPASAPYALFEIGRGDPNLKANLAKLDAWKDVPYLNERQRNRYRVELDNGVLQNRQIRTSEKSQEFIYVMDQYGTFYISTRERVKHHSSFFSGQPVAAAGVVKLAHGRVVSISNESGHYQPSKQSFDQAVEELHRSGIDDFEAIYLDWEGPAQAAKIPTN